MKRWSKSVGTRSVRTTQDFKAEPEVGYLTHIKNPAPQYRPQCCQDKKSAVKVHFKLFLMFVLIHILVLFTVVVLYVKPCVFCHGSINSRMMVCFYIAVFCISQHPTVFTVCRGFLPSVSRFILTCSEWNEAKYVEQTLTDFCFDASSAF